MGDFSEWEMRSMSPSQTTAGAWEVTCALAAGYAGNMDFVIDGRFLRRVGPVHVDGDMVLKATALGIEYGSSYGY